MEPLKPAIKASLGKATTVYTDALEGSPAEAFLAGRGFTPETISRFKFGYVANPQNGHDRYAGMLSIPSLAPEGVRALRFRCIEDHSCKEMGHGKYQGITGMASHLFNIGAYHSADRIIAVTEGELDAVSLEQANIPAIGVSGGNSWKRHYPRVLAEFPTVLVFADADDAGRKFAADVSLSLEQGARIVSLDGAKDPNEFLQLHGTDALYRAVMAEEEA